ncbi:TPA: hypothetical protein MBI04_003574 [Klebsiella pneumoniae]|nr:hypothetical protein [Klebsiella pneumoniae]
MKKLIIALALIAPVVAQASNISMGHEVYQCGAHRLSFNIILNQDDSTGQSDSAEVEVTTSGATVYSGDYFKVPTDASKGITYKYFNGFVYLESKTNGKWQSFYSNDRGATFLPCTQTVNQWRDVK